MTTLNKAWNKITNNGIDTETLGKDVIKIQLLNQIVFIGCITTSLNFTTHVLTQAQTPTILAVTFNLFIELLVLYLIYRHSYKAARFITCWFFPTLLAFHTVMIDTDFGKANIFTALAFLNFIIFDDKKRIQIPIVIYTCLLFMLSKLYVIHSSTEILIEKNPYDEITTFPMIVMILGTIFLLYQKSLQRYEEQQAVLIKDLEQKNKDLESLNDELEQFTYIASHDLKTPLRAINSHVGLAKRHLVRKNYDAIDTSLNFISKGAKQMYALVSDILEYKTISNQITNSEPLDLNEILTDVLFGLKVLLIEKNAEVTTSTLPKVLARKRDFIILFQNLIENSIKYNTAEIPQINVQTKIETDVILISVKDNGIGIAPEYHKKIFQFFKRLHRNETYEGTGIGLGLCQKIVHQYNGKITVQSTKGQGATFIIELPISILQ